MTLNIAKFSSDHVKVYSLNQTLDLSACRPSQGFRVLSYPCFDPKSERSPVIIVDQSSGMSALGQGINDQVMQTAHMSPWSPPQSPPLPSYEKESGIHLSPEAEIHTHLRRKLQARQVSMIAIGGAIGTGLIIGTGSALAKAGPASVFIAYSIVGCIVYLVMVALGEMAAWLPIELGFTAYATRFCDPALGFCMGYTYWLKYIVVAPNQLTAAALTIQYWVPRDRVNPGVFIAIFLIVIVLINYLGISYFAEVEFWLSTIKVLTLCGLIILSLVLMLGGGPDHDRKGFRYWKDPGAFNELYGTGNKGRFLAVWSAFVSATFAFLGTEIVGVTIGEMQNPRKDIPRAIKLIFWRIVMFYVLSVLLVGLLVPYNSKTLAFANKGSAGASASPFVVAIVESGIRVLPALVNACILVFVLSASNSDLYISSRTLYSLAQRGIAPSIFARTNRRGVPLYSLMLSALLSFTAFLNVSDDSRVVFGYFVNLVTIFGILTWINILISHICFVRARRSQGVETADLPYVSPFGITGSYIALAACIMITLFKNFDVFIYDPNRPASAGFDYKNFITGYLGIPLYLAMILGFKFVKKTRYLRPRDVDLFTDKDIIDREEEEYLRRKALKEKTRLHTWLYKHCVSWLL